MSCFDFSAYIDNHLKGADQTERFLELDHLFQIQTVRKQLNDFYRHQLCYGI